MPKSEKARRAAFAEVARRKKGGKAKSFEGMKTDELESYAKKPLDKSRRGEKHRPKAGVQAKALREMKD
jgi:hypothetical protein